MFRCATEDEDAETMETRMMLRMRSTRADTITATNIFVQPRYRVLYSGSQNNVGLAFIQAQHEMLNISYNLLNSDKEKVPKSGSYNFYDSRGDPLIVFLPVDYTEVAEGTHIERILIPPDLTFSSSNPLASVLAYLSTRDDVETIVENVINILIVPLSGAILGQAYIESNTCVVQSLTVGGPRLLAPIVGYQLGRTMVHEVGHCFGLPHVFSGCVIQPFLDIPKQTNPNYDAFLFQTVDGWSGALCNRMRDQKIQEGDTSYEIPGSSPPYSCNESTTTFEQFMNYMDYVLDAYMIMFSVQQAVFMKSWLLSQSVIELQANPGEQFPPIPAIPEVDVPQRTYSSVIPYIPVWSIILLSVFIGILLGILVWRIIDRVRT